MFKVAESWESPSATFANAHKLVSLNLIYLTHFLNHTAGYYLVNIFALCH